MVRSLSVSLDDSDFEEIKRVKKEIGETWEDFVIQATGALAEREDIEVNSLDLDGKTLAEALSGSDDEE